MLIKTKPFFSSHLIKDSSSSDFIDKELTLTQVQNKKSICSNSINKVRNQVRTFYKKAVKKLNPAVKAKKQKQIVQYLNKLAVFKSTGVIAGYKALKEEVCLDSFYAAFDKKQVAFPVMHLKNLEFYTCSGVWKKAKLFPVFEPEAKIKNKVSLKDISVFLVPGVVFDKKGERLGRGQGFYDRTFAMLNLQTTKSCKSLSHLSNYTPSFFTSTSKKVWFIGVAFIEQVHSTNLPKLKTDVNMDLLVTDRWVLDCKQQTFL